MKISPECILIVGDGRRTHHVLRTLVQQGSYETLEAADSEQALALIRDRAPDVLLDCGGPHAGQELRRLAREFDPDLPVVTMTPAESAAESISATGLDGRGDVVPSSEHGTLMQSIRAAIIEHARRRSTRTLLSQAPEAVRLQEMMGASEAAFQICADVARVARSDFTVLINGETGCGKELVAHAIHQASLRAAGPFIAVDCGAIPETLFESELFGHEKGAFTGAALSHPGKFEAAQGGTLFLDEISNMPLSSQAKLLRALQERTVYRVGGTHPVKSDTRVLVAASDDLETATAKGMFRKDLFFRLAEFTIRVPPLRERKLDILFLAKTFMEITNQELGKNVTGISDAAEQCLLDFDWPGNVRQLRSTIRRAVLLADTVVGEEHLDLPQSCFSTPVGTTMPSEPDEWTPLRQLVRQATIAVERDALLRTLTQTGWNKAKAARLLQIDYKTMHTKVKEYGLRRPSNGLAASGAP